ncbi:hypothetical protein ACIPSE_28800 [Streptomyces sp. NPDC090106]|uniref:hypothetical protein n=1 Tax=Streptomyces sp. NPDC090106 TaxID=3365946 RepID=UPI0037FDF82B
METINVKTWETAVLDGGPADGLRMKVADRPRVIQVTYPCQVEAAPQGLRADGVYIYRRDHDSASEPLRYGFDIASP